MSESLAASPGLWIAIAAVVAAALGYAIGRIGGAAARRARASSSRWPRSAPAHDKARASTMRTESASRTTSPRPRSACTT